VAYKLIIVSRYLFYISQNYSFAILRPLQEVILRRGGQVAWFIEGRDVNLNYFNKDETLFANVEQTISFNPIAVFVPGNVVPDFIPGLKVAVFHGFNSGKKNRRGFEDHFNIRGCFDLYCTQGPNTTRPFKLLAKKHQFFSVTETGWPAIDPLFKSLPQEKSIKPTILMCSTFSRFLTCAPHLYEEVRRLSEKGNWQWVIQFHPKMDRDIVEQYKLLENENLSFVETDNVIPLLQKADVMVCDTSSVLIMFLLLGKPVVTYKNIAPDNYLIDIDKPKLLEASINKALSRPQELMKAINTFINDTHPYNDGNSSERILDEVDSIINKNKLPQKKKPKNILRTFKMRRKLRYWKF